MKKVKTIEEAKKVFDLLGIKEVGKRWQHKKGTWVYELPFKTYYGSGHSEVNRFAVYKSGYVRKMCVAPNGASRSCWQLNKTYKTKEKWWNSYYKEYRDWVTTKRILIDRHDDRVVYLCNYILKNYYRNSKVSLVGKYTVERINQQQTELRNSKGHDLPFKCESEVFTKDEVKVIINGHRYNLS